MCTTPSELLASAQKIAALQPSSEADVRAVISRAYYAALHGVASAFPGEDLSHSGNSHDIIISRAEAFGKSLTPGRTEAAQAARDLRKFKKMRKIADYQLEAGIQPDEAARSVALGEAILGFCEIILSKQAVT